MADRFHQEQSPRKAAVGSWSRHLSVRRLYRTRLQICHAEGSELIKCMRLKRSASTGERSRQYSLKELRRDEGLFVFPCGQTPINLYFIMSANPNEIHLWPS